VVGFTTGSRAQVPGKKKRKPVRRNDDDDNDDDDNNNNNNNNNNNLFKSTSMRCTLHPSLNETLNVQNVFF
jgi:hypothetical protein